MMLESNRLLIRPYEDPDFSFMYAMNRDPDVMKFIREPVTEEAPVLERIEQMKAYRVRFPKLGTFVVVHQSSGALVGNAVIRHADYQPDREIEIGYLVAKEFWGQGLATELVARVCDYVFQVLAVPAIFAFTDEGNVASNRVLGKNGFQLVGRELIYEGDLLKWRLDRPV